MNIRVGHGFDVHAFSSENIDSSGEESIIMGGVRIPFNRSLIAHSDGDVLIHALCDALLGSLALGDIGVHFPDSNQEYKLIDSRKLLRKVMELLLEKKFKLSNADIVIIAQEPKMSDYILQMREQIAIETNVCIDQISIKATTTEKLGFIGRGEGIACHAVVLVSSLNS
jgi:2-C-methyl-D-erythritol 2,4-cyclodiphosphate synthase